MRIALVGPELEENLALRCIHAAVVRAGHEARIFDFHAPEQTPGLAAEIAAYRPELVGLSMVFTARAREFLALAAELRAPGFAGHVTAGGHFASLNAEQLLADFPAVDSVVLGEGEEALVDLAENLDRPDRVAGLTWRTPDGRIASTGPRTNPDDLDTRPFPTRPEVFPTYLGLPIANMLSGRGCYGNCRFCSINAWHRHNPGKRFRQRDVRRVAEEMAGLYHDRGVRIFNFHDDNFFLPAKRDNLARLGDLRRELDTRRVGRIGLQVKARPDSVDVEVMSLLKEIGLFRVFLGVETNAVAGLEMLGRGIDRRRNHQALDVLARLGVHTCFNLLVFDPQTRFEDIEENIALMRSRAEFPLNFCRVEVYAGTDIHRMLAEQGRLEGSYLGHSYQIADPAVQLAYTIFRDVFTPRNFTPEGMNHQAMKVDYYFHLLAHFYPDRVRRGLRRQVKGLVAELNRNNAALLERICRFAGAASLPGGPAVAETTAELSAERTAFDAAMGRRMACALALIRERACSSSPRRGGLLSAAASVAAAALVVTVVGCKDSEPPETHMSEMAPAPVEPGGGEQTEPSAMRELSPEDAASVEDAIDRRHGTDLVACALNHKFPDSSVDLYLELDGEGRVTEYEVRLPDDSHSAFRKDLGELIKWWQFPFIEEAGSCTVSLEFTLDELLPPETHMSEMAPVPFDPPVPEPPETHMFEDVPMHLDPPTPPPETHMHEMAPGPIRVPEEKGSDS